MESGLFLFELLSDDEPPLRRHTEFCTLHSAFCTSPKGCLGIAKARFMESGLFLFELLSEHEPLSGVLLIISELRKRFMESALFLFELLSEHEPARIGGAARPSFAA